MKFEDKYPEVARPYTACFVILRRKDRIAMVLRKNTSYMDGYYGLPAGKCEWFETFTKCAIREAKEEAGVNIAEKDLKFVHLVHRHGEDVVSGKFMKIEKGTKINQNAKTLKQSRNSPIPGLCEISFFQQKPQTD